MITKDLGAVSAYAYAVEKGYTGTEAEYAELMASYATVAQQAGESAQTASEKAQQASASATSASQSASSASASAQTAQTAQQTATAKASEAQQSAQTATTKAQEASQSASESSQSASTAVQAKQDAQTAKTASETAQASAEGSATTAQTAAQTATQKAAEAAESARTLTIDKTLTQEGQAADAKAVGDEISDLKEDLSANVDDLKSALVSKKGENQVTPQNIEGMQYTKTTEEAEGENIFTSDMLFREGTYVIVADDGTVGLGSNASYNAYCIPVEQNTKYKFTTSRFVVLATGNSTNSLAIGTTMSNLSEAETGDATYLFLSINVNSISNIYVKPVTVDVVYSDFILPDWLVNNLPIPTVVEKPKFATVTGDIASGGNLQLTSPRNNLRKGERIIFEGNIASFDTIRIGLSFTTVVGTDSNQINTFRIDGTNISYYAKSNSTPVTVPHGLTIANNIQIIWEMSAVASCKITLISDGNLFVHEFTNFVRQVVGSPFVLSDGTVLTDCKLTWACNDIDKSIWMFGDSYFAYSDTRWTYYLHQYGYDQNCLLDGFPGEGGTNGRVAFNKLLQFGTPKYAVWCLGMNDGSDSDSAPATDWVNARDLFLQYCENNGVTPMFGTIPTVPTINHEQKNAWIRSSGYRYIDFAKAVGANANGVWYSGMLSSDGVHPTAQGARALFARVLLDLPEIMIGGYGTPTAINS